MKDLEDGFSAVDTQVLRSGKPFFAPKGPLYLFTIDTSPSLRAELLPELQAGEQPDFEQSRVKK
jgi:hypothetical protein